MSLIEIQDEYIEKVSQCRWANGLRRRVLRGARKRLVAKLEKQGYSHEQALQAYRDAHDMYELNRAAAEQD